MKIYFRKDNTLVISPETTVEAMALKYWQKEYDEHAGKVLEVSTDVPIQLPSTPTE